MLTLIIGPAGTGKTGAVMEEIRRSVESGRGGNLLLVPEQYSHEAERELCSRCGDSLSLYAEVFSFTGLARRLSQELGGAGEAMLDKGGRLLCMALALSQLGPQLRVYSAARRKAELQSMLLQVLDELKSACVGPEQLMAASACCEGALADKLHDLSLICGAYDSVLAQGRADPADRLTRLALQIPDSPLGPENRVYVDGFIDFTYQEQAVLHAMMQKGVELTVCLTADGMEGREEIFALSRAAGRRLIRGAESLGIPVQIREMEEQEGKHPALRLFAREMFRYGPARWEGEPVPVRLLRAEDRSAECETAAAEILSLLRSGCRWREIAVAVRGFEEYRGHLESCFRRYGIPLFVAKRSELLAKPLPALIALAYEILQGGWDVDDVISYLRTGLTGLSEEDADLLAGYVFKWQLRAGAWERPGDWKQHPDGYGAEPTEDSAERLARINALRRRVARPLLRLAKGSRMVDTAEEQAAALAIFLEDLELPEQLERRQKLLESQGKLALAGEYAQLWELIISALEQCAAILGSTEMDAESFGKLYLMMLSQYDIGLIPVALDRVGAGDFDRMRRRNIRHLIVLGCSDDRLPPAHESAGVFSDEERERLLELSIDLGAGEAELWREFSLIYQTLSLPSESLTMICPRRGAEGEALRPAYVFQRAKVLFGLEEENPDPEQTRLWAAGPALSLAASSFRGGGPRAAAAAAYFSREEPERFEKLRSAAAMSRGRLSPGAVEALYGKRLSLSASRADRFASCQFAYFCQYGLKARPSEPAGFTAPEIGTFMHYVLEHVAREVKELGGFSAVSDEQLEQLCQDCVEQYIHRELDDFREKSGRFVYLFRRVCQDVRQVVRDMAEELRRSDFEPLDFELDFSRAEDFRPLELDEGGERLRLTGIADRVDGWVHEGKLYLRVVDYKTGRKVFSLSELWYGMGLQMLLYLLALEEDGERRYRMPVEPAGVMYIPARNAMLSLPAELPDEELARKRAEELRRSGLVLQDDALIEAWEKGTDKRYIPVKLKSGRGSCHSLADAERMGALFRHIRSCLSEMAGQLRRGSIAADPWYRGQQENACLNCDYRDACFFADGENDEHCRYLPKLTDEEVWERIRWEQEKTGEGRGHE